MGVPPALPGRQQKFDISGGRHRRAIDETPNREQPSTRRGVPSRDDYESLSHSKWECKYHAVFIPKCRRKTLYLELRRHLGDVFRKLAEQKESRIEEGHLLVDHVHMLISIPPKHAVSQVIGFIKGKSAIHLGRGYGAAAAWPRLTCPYSKPGVGKGLPKGLWGPAWSFLLGC
jgi:REP element-mobilizing transposase RayT